MNTLDTHSKALLATLCASGEVGTLLAHLAEDMVHDPYGSAMYALGVAADALHAANASVPESWEYRSAIGTRHDVLAALLAMPSDAESVAAWDAYSDAHDGHVINAAELMTLGLTVPAWADAVRSAGDLLSAHIDAVRLAGEDY